MAVAMVHDAWATADARHGVGMEEEATSEPEPEAMSSASVGVQDDWSRFEAICEALLADTPEVTPVASSPVSLVPETAGAVVGSEVATHSQVQETIMAQASMRSTSPASDDAISVALTVGTSESTLLGFDIANGVISAAHQLELASDPSR